MAKKKKQIDIIADGEGNVSCTVDGETKVVKAALLQAWVDEANAYLAEVENQNGSLKELAEGVEGQTGLPKSFVTKYFKAAYKAKTAEAVAGGKVFEALDEARGVTEA